MFLQSFRAKCSSFSAVSQTFLAKCGKLSVCCSAFWEKKLLFSSVTLDAWWFSLQHLRRALGILLRRNAVCRLTTHHVQIQCEQGPGAPARSYRTPAGSHSHLGHQVRGRHRCRSWGPALMFDLQPAPAPRVTSQQFEWIHGGGTKGSGAWSSPKRLTTKCENHKRVF